MHVNIYLRGTPAYWYHSACAGVNLVLLQIARHPEIADLENKHSAQSEHFPETDWWNVTWNSFKKRSKRRQKTNNGLSFFSLLQAVSRNCNLCVVRKLSPGILHYKRKFLQLTLHTPLSFSRTFRAAKSCKDEIGKRDKIIKQRPGVKRFEFWCPAFTPHAPIYSACQKKKKQTSVLQWTQTVKTMEVNQLHLIMTVTTATLNMNAWA